MRAVSDRVGSVAWITIAPVKALGLVHRDEVELEAIGVRENRAFYLVDEDGRMINGKVAGTLVQVVPDWDGAANRLRLELPGGAAVEDDVELGDEVATDFFGRPVTGRLVVGPWSEALSELAERPLRLVKADRPGSGVDRGTGAGVSLVSTASLASLADAAGVEAVDGRRFRMLFGIDGVPAYAEDGWIGGRVRLGEAVIMVRGNVGRCAVTTQNPDTGVPDLDTLRVLGEYRANVETTEPRPFGVWGLVVEPGRVRLGDPVAPFTAV